MAEEVLLVFSTWPDAESARAAGQTLVDERLAACANLLPAVESIYRWKGAVEKSREVLMLLKTTIGRYPDLERRLQELHSYEVPEVLAFHAADGLPAYLRWVEESCQQSDTLPAPEKARGVVPRPPEDRLGSTHECSRRGVRSTEGPRTDSLSGEQSVAPRARTRHREGGTFTSRVPKR